MIQIPTAHCPCGELVYPLEMQVQKRKDPNNKKVLRPTGQPGTSRLLVTGKLECTWWCPKCHRIWDGVEPMIVLPYKRGDYKKKMGWHNKA